MTTPNDEIESAEAARTIKVAIPLHGGDLPFMITWQTLDGRPNVAFYERVRDAIQRRDQLRNLGRTPKLWLDVTDQFSSSAKSAKSAVAP